MTGVIYADPFFLRMCLDASRMVAAWFNPSVPPSSARWSTYLDRKEDRQRVETTHASQEGHQEGSQWTFVHYAYKKGTLPSKAIIDQQ